MAKDPAEVDAAVAQILEGIESRPHRLQRRLIELAQLTDRVKTQEYYSESTQTRALQHRLGRVAHMERYEAEAAGLFDELEDEGFLIDNLGNLRSPGKGDRRAVPILLDWFRHTGYLPLKEDILQALTSPWADPDAMRPLFNELDVVDEGNEEESDRLRWGIVATLMTHPVAPWRDDYLRLAQNPKYGIARQAALLALGKLRKDRESLVPMMEEYVRSDELSLVMGAAVVLKTWKPASARPIVAERLATEEQRAEPRPAVITQLKSTLRALEKRTGARPADILSH